MPRNIPGTSLQAILAQQTGEAILCLLDITDENGVVYRMSNDSVDTVVVDVTYLALPFDIIFPDSVDGQQQQATLTLENVSRDLIDEIRLHTLPLTVDMRLVLGSDPTEILAEWNDFKMRQVSYDAMTLQGQLTQASFMNEMVGVLMTGSNFPGLFYV